MEKNKGITLIALIITIIVMLILAGVAINAIVGQGSIIGNAEKTVGMYNNSVEQEQSDLDKLSDYLDESVNPNQTILQKFTKNPENYKNAEQSATNSDIAISEDGESVNLDLWSYVLETQDDNVFYILTSPTDEDGYYVTGGGKAYKGEIENGAIVGKMPAYIYNAESGKIIEVKELRSTFEGISELTVFPEIPSTITEICYETFRGTGIEKAVLPDTITAIWGWTYLAGGDGFGPFEDCENLTSVKLPKNITSIGPGTFNGCTSLTNIEIPSSVTTIGICAFEGCTGLTSIEISSSVTTIAEGAFRGCTGLTSIEIPNSVTTIAEGAFRECTGLTSIEIPNSVTTIDNDAFEGCTGLTSIKIPSSVTTIGYRAFRGCTGLTSIEIPSSVVTMRGSAFYGWTSSQAIYIDGTSISSSWQKGYSGWDVYKNWKNNCSAKIYLRDATTGEYVLQE